METEYFCNQCPSKKFTNKTSFLRHKQYHKNKIKKINDNKQTKKVFKCYFCNIPFDNENSFILHTQILHEGKNKDSEICNECGKQFSTKPLLINHLESKCGTYARFSCDECGKRLMTRGALYHHQLRHANKRRYMCRFCAKTFLTNGQLIVHERKHTKEKAFICEVCNKGFCYRQSLITHSTIHTGIKPFQCEGCGNAFSCVGNLIKHHKTHSDTCGKVPLTSHRISNEETKLKLHANTPASVKLVQKKKEENITLLLKRNSKEKLLDQSIVQIKNNPIRIKDENEEQHSKIEISEENLENVLLEKVKIKIEPDSDNFCNEDLSNPADDVMTLDETEIKTEIKTEDDKKDFMANFEQVPLVVKTENLIEEKWSDNTVKVENGSNVEHYGIHEFKEDSKNDSNSSSNLDVSKKNTTKKVKKLFKLRDKHKSKDGKKCQYCSQIYFDLGWLRRHEQKHIQNKNKLQGKENKLKCACCSLIFNTKEEKYVHQQKEHQESLSCNICHKLFKNPDGVRVHMRFSHLGIPRKTYCYICDKCGKKFNSLVTLQGHEKTNCSPQNQFKCETCGKMFATIYILRYHNKIHEDKSTFVCKFCGKGFVRKNQLQIHERSHTGEKPFKCEFCPKAFAYRESLITHNSTHTGVKPHMCFACGAQFSCVGNLIKHRRTRAATCGKINMSAEKRNHNFPNGDHVNMRGVYSKKHFSKLIEKADVKETITV